VGSTHWSWSGSNFLPGTVLGVEDPHETPLVALANGDFQYWSYSTDLQQVFEHELGHALGLDHNPADPNAVMYPIEGPSNNSGPDASDIQAIQSLYGAPAPQPNFIYDANAAMVPQNNLAGLGQGPDPYALSPWDIYLSWEATLSQLAQQLSQSPEFQLWNYQPYPAYAGNLYVSGVGRPTDPGAVQSWPGTLQVASLNPDSALAPIDQSQGGQ
jgi:Matrixin